MVLVLFVIHASSLFVYKMQNFPWQAMGLPLVIKLEDTNKKHNISFQSRENSNILNDVRGPVLIPISDLKINKTPQKSLMSLLFLTLK